MDRNVNLEVRINRDPAKWTCRVCKRHIDSDETVVIFPPRNNRQREVRQHFDCTVESTGSKFKERLEDALMSSNLRENDKQALLTYLRSM
ncbi:MAG: hypothetical protein ACFFD4_01600 [Candidatus Odinarchaeota archaeon]